MRRIAGALAVLVALVVALVAAGLAAPAVQADPPRRAYHLYVPPGPTAGKPLLLYLHGCQQTSAEAEAATRLDDLADEFGFVIAYAEQVVAQNSSAPLAEGNGIGCWNWFLPEHQERDQGEPAALAAIARDVVADLDLDPARVYVEGISAGADMAVILGAVYPDLFAAVAPIEGCAYRACADASGHLTYDAMGERARVVPMFTVQGTADTLNAAPLGVSLVESWLGAQDLADNGAADGSIARTPAAVEHRAIDQTPQPGSGDPCVRNHNWPCPGGVVGFQEYPTTVATYADAAGCPVLESWLVHGMEHGQPDADGGPFTDPLGPDISRASWLFLSQHSTAPCGGTQQG